MIKWLIYVLLVGGTVAFLATDLPAGELFSEDWESGNIQTTEWTKWGYPDSVVQSGGDVQGSYSFDPNGDGSYHSGVVSTNTYPLAAGLRLSVDAYVESASYWSELNFGLANTTAVTPNNVHLKHVAMITIDADTQGSATPAEDNYKFYTAFQGSGGGQLVLHSAVPGLAADSVFDGWNNFSIDFKQNGSAQVLVNGVRTFESDAGLYDYGVDNSFAIVLAGRSYGSTVNLFDSILVTQSPEPSAVLMLFLGGLGLLVRRARRP